MLTEGPLWGAARDSDAKKAASADRDRFFGNRNGSSGSGPARLPIGEPPDLSRRPITGILFWSQRLL